MLFSPFEQFELTSLLPIFLGSLDISITNLTITLGLVFSICILLFLIITNHLTFIPNNWQALLEIFYLFLLSLIIEQAGIRARIYFPAIFTVFFFI